MKRKICVVLDNLRSAQNVGSILRSSDAFGIDKVFMCGITPTPEDKKVLKTSLGAEKALSWEHVADISELIMQLKDKGGYTIVSLEQTEKSNDLKGFQGSEDNICLIVGNEVSGVSKEALNLSDKYIHIPMLGEKESLNVSVAYGIAAYIIS